MTDDVMRGLQEQVKAAKTVTVTRNRYGYELDGERLKRVTTLLQGIPKGWLGTWAAKMVAEFAVDHRNAWAELPRTDAIKLLKGAPWSKRDDAGDRGTAIHAALEAYTRGEPIPTTLNEDEAACTRATTDFLTVRAGRALATELTVINLTMGYAGTLDLWEIKDGVSWILDYKSSSGIYAEHAVQQVAYQRAEFAVVQKKQTGDEKWVGKLIPWGPHVAERLGIVHVKPDGAKLYPIREDYTDKLWNVFRAAAFMKNWQSDVDDYGGKTPRENVYEDSSTVEQGSAK